MIQVNTRQYELAHGKKPRGYGNWAFFFDGRTEIEEAFWHNGKFSEASKMAVAYAVAKKFMRIEVGS